MSDDTPRSPGPFERLRRLSVDAARSLYLDDERPGVALVVRAWRSGALGRFGIATLLVGIAIAAALLTEHDGRAQALTPMALWVTLALLLCATALGLAAARALPLPLYVTSALAIGWYGSLPAGGVAGTPLFAVPPLTLLALGWVSARANPVRGRRWWLLLLALEVGWMSRRALGLSFSDDALDTAAGLGLGLALWGLVANRRALACSRFQPGAGVTFGLVAMAFGATWGIGTALDPDAGAERVMLLCRGLLLPLALFWLWLGATTFQGALALGRWAVRTSIGVLGVKAVTRTLPALWLAVGVFAWLATWPVPLSAAVIAHDLGLTAWAQSWGDGLWFAVRWQVWASLGAVGVWLVQRVRRRHGAALVGWLHALWVAAFLGALGLWEAAEYAVSAAEEAEPATLWTAVMLVGGIIWEVARASGGWSEASAARAIGLLGALIAVLATLIATLAAQVPDLLVEYGFYAFLGVIVLGLPLAIAELAAGESEQDSPRAPDASADAPRLGGAWLVGLGLVGAASASLTMGIDAYATPTLGLAPPLWALALWRVRARWRAVHHAMIKAGGALGVGFGLFWLSPEALPIPLFDAWQARYLELDLARPVFDLGAFLLPLSTMTIGAGLGHAMAWRSRRLIAPAIALASVLMMVAPPLLPDIPTAPAGRGIGGLPVESRRADPSSRQGPPLVEVPRLTAAQSGRQCDLPSMAMGDR